MDDDDRGYLTALAGTVGGAIVIGVPAACVGFGIGLSATRDDPYGLPGLAALPVGALGIAVGATLGCWYALHAGEYRHAEATAALVCVLVPLVSSLRRSSRVV
jgi:hypothetical protein